MKKIVAVCGGFDPLTPGHIDYFKRAKKLGDILVVLVNGNDFLINKKGYYFMPLEDRCEIIKSVEYVDAVIPCIDKDDTVAETLKMIKPDIFAKGGDRNLSNLPQKEIDVCKEIDCEIICGVGDKKYSSSWYLDRFKAICLTE